MKPPGKSREQFGTSDRGTRENPFVKWLLILIAMAFCLVFLFLPIVNVFAQAFSKGLAGYVDALVRPIAVARCDLDPAIAVGLYPMPGSFAMGHEMVGEVVAKLTGSPEVVVDERALLQATGHLLTLLTSRRGG